MKPLRFISTVLSLLLITSTIAQSQIEIETLQQKVDSMFLDISDGVNPGTAILIVKDNNVILNKGFGYANLEHQVAITPTTVFDLASLAKQFTGYSISILIKQGKVSKNDDVKKYLPEFPDFGQKITIGNLLHHTSGLRDWTTTFPLAGQSFDNVISYDQILRMVQEQKQLNFNPGTKYLYSNTGYNLLVEVLQRVTKTSFREWTHQNIFLPLEMSNTHFLDNHNEVINDRATGYYKDRKGNYNYTPNNLTALGSSSLYSTTTDLAKWVTHLMDPKDESKPVIDQMFQTDTLINGDENDYASGILITKFKDTPLIAHSGSWASFSTYLSVFPDHKLSIVVLNNREKNASRIARKIASLFIANPKEEKSKNEITENKKIDVSEKILDEYVGTYKLGPSWFVHLTREKNKLWVQATNEDKFLMTALSKNKFRIKEYGNRTMSFHKNDKGEVAYLVYNKENRPKVSNDIKFESINPSNYIGKYYSEELHTTYKVIVNDGKLKLWHIFNGESSLEAVWDDSFLNSQWFARNIEFNRDKLGKITGLQISQQRAKNQLFKKID